MVKSCCIAGCTANKQKNQERQFYIIPQEPIRRKKWKSAINRAVLNPEGTVNKTKLWSPRSCHTYVCSAHFITGAKVNDPTHPDYVPTIFPKKVEQTKSGKSSSKVDRFERAAKRSAREVNGTAQSAARKRLKLSAPQNQEFEESEPIEEMTLLSPGPEKQEQLSLVTPLKDRNTQAIDQTEPETPLQTIDDVETETSSTNFATPMQAPLTPSEREMLYTELNNVRRERDEALQRIESLEKLVNASSLTSTAVEGNNEQCKMLTGVSWDVFIKIFLFLSTFVGSKQSCPNLPQREQLFVTLVKLHHNLSFEFLAQVKGIPKTTMIDYFWKWIDLMYAKLSFMVHWPDREKIFQTIPNVFRGKFPRLTSIVDCFEIFIEAPKNLLARAQCYSNYKKHCTVKFFISCTPLGSINFISKAWGGRASDVHIVRESGFVSSKFHHPGDQILADRGFTLHDDFAANCSAELLTLLLPKERNNSVPVKLRLLVKYLQSEYILNAL